MQLATNQVKVGTKVLINDEPCSVVDTEFVKPGKGQAFTRIKVRSLKTGRILEKTLKSGDTIEAADAVETKLQYLYFDGSNYVFMATNTSCTQYEIAEQILGDTKHWLQDQVECTAVIWNEQIIQMAPPTSLEIEVTETEPSVKNDTATGGNKLATLANGIEIRVPLFIQSGEVIKVNPTTQEYISRKS